MWSPSKKFGDVSYRALFFGIALFFMAYEIARALNVAMTFDEAATYLNYISSDFLSLFNFDYATNHFINTFLTKICYALGGNHDFVLRIPNLLGYVLYLVFSFLLLNRFVRKTTAVFGFFLLNLNPYVLDFFSLCRGYGLSLGFLMASLYFFTSFLSRYRQDASGAVRLLTISLGTAGVSVLCNFTLLNVYLSLVALAALLFLISNYRNKEYPQIPTSHPARFPRAKTSLFLILLIAVFNVLVISQDTGLSPKLFEAVSVRIPGFAEEEMKDVAVTGMDQKKQEKPFSYRNGVWTTDQPLFLTGFRLKVPAALSEKISGFEVKIGRETFSSKRDDLRKKKRTGPRRAVIWESPWTVSLRKSAIPIFKPAVNWKGDGNYLILLSLRFLCSVSIFVLFAAFVYAACRVIVRKKILSFEQFRRLAHPTLALAGFIIYPLFMLVRNHELYWGGLGGLIRSTWTSLVSDSFYGKLYAPWQNLFIGILCLLSVFLFAALYARCRKKSPSKLLPGALFPAIIFLVSLSTILQRILFNTHYLIGRTALFLIPLSVLFFIFSLQYLREVSRTTKGISILILAVITFFSVYHFYQTANTAGTVEWRSDADAKILISDLKNIKENEYSSAPRMTLGIQWIFFPSLTYYLKQKNISWIDLHIISELQEYDLYYVEETFDTARMILLKRYPLSGNILAKARKP